MAKHNVMEKFRLSLIAAVDRPAQEGARAAIMKRDDSADAGGLYLAKGAALSDKAEAYLKNATPASELSLARVVASGDSMLDGAFPIADRAALKCAVEAYSRAKNPALAKAHIISRARALDATSVLPDAWKVSKLQVLGDVTNDQAVAGLETLVKSFIDAQIDAGVENDLAVAKAREYANVLVAEVDKSVCAMRDVVEEVFADAGIVNKAEALQESESQFNGHIQGIAPELSKSAIFAAALEGAGLAITEGGALTKRETTMFDIKKSLGLPATATDADIEKAQAIVKAGAEFALNVLKMSPAHVAYMAVAKQMQDKDGVAKQTFAALTAEKRDEVIKEFPPEQSDDDKAKAKAKMEAEAAAKRAGDEVLKVDGREIRKSVVGDDTFAVMKSQQQAIEKANDERAQGVIAKRADTSMTLIGKSDELATLIHGIAKLDGGKDLAEQVAKKFEQLNEVAKSGKVFAEVGKSGGGGGFAKASVEIETKAAEMVSKGEAKSIFKARDAVRRSNPELAKREEEERKDAAKAA